MARVRPEIAAGALSCASQVRCRPLPAADTTPQPPWRGLANRAFVVENSNPRSAMPAGHTLPSDIEIRKALFTKKLDRLRSQDVLIIDELGLAHAKSRIDVAVINGCLHGYEIKSAQDSLTRLPGQIATYRDTLERLTVVCASKHIEGVVRLAPDWCGITEARQGGRGGIHFHTVRRSTKNPEVKPTMLAHLLWHAEAVSLLSRYDVSSHDLRRPRKHLYAMIAELMTPKEITRSIREFMQQRAKWRDRPVLA